MADEHLLSKVHSLSDLELAFLLSLIAREHCQIRTPSSAIPDLVAELRLISTKIFHLQPVVISCTPQTTLDDFAAGLLLTHPSPTTTTPPPFRSPSPLATRSPRQKHHDGPSSYFHPQTPGAPTMAPIILAANLDLAPKAVQIQALELLRTRRVFTRTSVHTAPKTFLFVAVVSSDRRGGDGLNRWLNEWFYLAHAHSPDDGYPNLDEEDSSPSPHPAGLGLYHHTDAASSESVVVKPSAVRAPSNGKLPAAPEPTITESDVSHLSQLARSVHADIDVSRYQMNVVSHLRMHRAVAGGVSPAATKHFEQLARSLAPLHGLDYVTPSLVQLAARKVYLHRIQIVAPERERSMQWGSELAAVEAVLEGLGAEEVIEDVLGLVAVPL